MIMRGKINLPRDHLGLGWLDQPRFDFLLLLCPDLGVSTIMMSIGVIVGVRPVGHTHY